MDYLVDKNKKIVFNLELNNNKSIEGGNKMARGVDIRIIQAPVEIRFDCPYCRGEVEIDFDRFGHDLAEILYNHVEFKCPLCNENLYIGEAELD